MPKVIAGVQPATDAGRVPAKNLTGAPQSQPPQTKVTSPNPGAKTKVIRPNYIQTLAKVQETAGKNTIALKGTQALIVPEVESVKGASGKKTANRLMRQGDARKGRKVVEIEEIGKERNIVKRFAV
jgi:hypothetical protein